MEENKMVAMPEEYEPMMPDGYGTGDDFFADEWTGRAADAQTEPEQEAETAEQEEAAPTTERPEDGQPEAQQEPDTVPEGSDAPRRLRFKARVDREDMDVDIGEDEVPTLYQLAKAGERWKTRNDAMRQQMDRYAQLAKGMGYESADEMVEKLSESYKANKVRALTESGTPEEIAVDYVERMMSRGAQPTATEPEEPPEAKPQPEQGRDVQAEAQEFAAARPDLKMKQLPMEVVEAWRNGENLLNAYTRFEAKQKESENRTLKKENKILKQNAASAAKAPVKGVSGGAPTDTEPIDPFIQGFDSDPW